MSDRRSSSNDHGVSLVDAHSQNGAMESLVGRFCAGDNKALEILLDEYSARFARRLRKEFWPKLSPDRCELIVNDAFLLAWQHCGQFVRLRGSLRAWLWRITYCRAVQLLREPWFKEFNNEKGLAPEKLALVCKCIADDVGPGHNDQLESDTSVAAVVRRAMEMLSPFERVVLLADMGAADEVAASAELSERTGLAKSTIRSYRARAHHKLKAELFRLGYRPRGGARSRV